MKEQVLCLWKLNTAQNWGRLEYQFVYEDHLDCIIQLPIIYCSRGNGQSFSA